MRLVAAQPTDPDTKSELETIGLSPTQIDFVEKLSKGMNPAMPIAFGGAHAIRTLLEHLEDADLDLSAASSEQEIARVAAAALRRRRSARRR